MSKQRASSRLGHAPSCCRPDGPHSCCLRSTFRCSFHVGALSAIAAGGLGTPRRSGGLARQQAETPFTAAAEPAVSAMEQAGSALGQVEDSEGAEAAAVPAGSDSLPGTRQSKRQVWVSCALLHCWPAYCMYRGKVAATVQQCNSGNWPW